jgi:hypothetical protein
VPFENPSSKAYAAAAAGPGAVVEKQQAVVKAMQWAWKGYVTTVTAAATAASQ